MENEYSSDRILCVCFFFFLFFLFGGINFEIKKKREKISNGTLSFHVLSFIGEISFSSNMRTQALS